MTAFRSHGFCFRCDAIEYLADLTDMEEIFLEETTLKTIPEPFTNLPRLSRIYIANSVPSPAHVVHSFQNVCLPESLGRLTSLTELIITNAQLHGRLLTCIGFLSNLKILNLSKNKLYGRIPKSVGSLKNLIHLNLERNELSGAIPRSITSLSNLQILNLGHNKLSGAIPSSIGNLEHLEKL
ncbi:hypothetical protein BDR26DRAFT_1006140 [Obelidium mucronatum]|nr:hypothetical protein BDR26DRAFT_1006140 [Obelidium mucronatum]